MGAESKIEWTDATFNPWWGCQRVSPGCERCYAESFAKRVGFSGRALQVAGQGPLRAPKPLLWGSQSPRRFFGEAHWHEPVKWNAVAERASKRRRVFCASMADVFEDRRDLDGWRERLFGLIEVTPALDWQLLTKRPQNVIAMVPERWRDGLPSNVWLGTTTEDQRRAEERVPHLLRCPAAVRFVSYEPALGPVDFTRLVDDELGADWDGLRAGINWVIVGGESGHGARPFDLAWARSVVEQCRAARVECFVKQLGARPIQPGPSDWDTDDLRLRDKKGGDWSEWPESLRVREFPRSAP